MKTTFFFALFLLVSQKGIGQMNLLDNSSFENTNLSTIYYDNCKFYTAQGFSNCVPSWNVAVRENDYGLPLLIINGNNDCKNIIHLFIPPTYSNGVPLYQDLAETFYQNTYSEEHNICMDYFIKPNNKNIIIIGPNYDDEETNPAGIYQNFNGSLIKGGKYLLKLKICPLNKVTVNHIEIFATTWGEHWADDNNNNKRLLIAEEWCSNVSNARWYQKEYVFTVPSNYELNYLVIFPECRKVNDGSPFIRSFFAIDDVELYKYDEYYCPNELLIENKTYDSYFYNNQLQNLNFDFYAGDVLKAGFDVGAPTSNGNVLVMSNATITYNAVTRVELLPGFTADEGSSFIADVKPCEGGQKIINPNSHFNENSLVPNNENLNKTSNNFNLKIYPNPTNNQLTIEYTTLQECRPVITLNDVYGKIVFHTELSGGKQTIDISTLPAGVYLLKFVCGEQTEVRKVIKQ
ncbi:MAG: T9SS type A sorting domain-containing protein [Bacteroidota bacterium]